MQIYRQAVKYNIFVVLLKFASVIKHAIAKMQHVVTYEVFTKYSYVYYITWRFDPSFSRRFRSPEGDTVGVALAATLSASNETIRPRKSLTSSFNRL